MKSSFIEIDFEVHPHWVICDVQVPNSILIYEQLIRISQ
jgi:hypothetical protein